MVEVKKRCGVQVAGQRRLLHRFHWFKRWLLSGRFLVVSKHLKQWCTTFFGHGPQIDLSNASGAKQVSRPKLHVGLGECVSTFTKMMCTVKHTA